MITRRVFEYLLVVVALVLIVISLSMNGFQLRKVVQDVLPNLIAALLAFGSIYFLFTRRNISIASLTGEDELRSEFREYIIPAGRSLEQAMNRAAEAYSEISQDAGLQRSPENLASITYIYRIMVGDIFLAYSTLMESWVNFSPGNHVLNPITKAKEYVIRASQGRLAVSEKSTLVTSPSGAVFIEAMKVLKLDLDSALGRLEAAMLAPAMAHEASESEPNRMQKTGETENRK